MLDHFSLARIPFDPLQPGGRTRVTIQSWRPKTRSVDSPSPEDTRSPAYGARRHFQGFFLVLATAGRGPPQTRASTPGARRPNSPCTPYIGTRPRRGLKPLSETPECCTQPGAPRLYPISQGSRSGHILPGHPRGPEADLPVATASITSPFERRPKASGASRIRPASFLRFCTRVWPECGFSWPSRTLGGPPRF